MLMRVEFPGVTTATSQQEPPGGRGSWSGSRRLLGRRVVRLQLMCALVPPSAVIHDGQIDLWGRGNIIGLHQLIRASGHKLGLRAVLAGPARCILPIGTRTVGCGGLLDVLSAAASRQATGTNYDKSILICRKGQFLKLAARRRGRAAEEEESKTGGVACVHQWEKCEGWAETQRRSACTVCRDVGADKVQFEAYHPASGSTQKAVNTGLNDTSDVVGKISKPFDVINVIIFY